MIRLANILDEAGIPYIWTIFTNDTNEILNPNILYVKPRLDIANYIMDADFLVQLSDCESYCFSVAESLTLGTPVIVTDLPVYKELGLNDENSIKLSLNFKTIPIEKITKKYKFKYTPIEDNWDDILVHKKSTYSAEQETQYLVEATSKYEGTNTNDLELTEKYKSRYVPRKGEQWLVDYDRKELLYEKGFINVIKEVKPKKGKKNDKKD